MTLNERQMQMQPQTSMIEKQMKALNQLSQKSQEERELRQNEINRIFQLQMDHLNKQTPRI